MESDTFDRVVSPVHQLVAARLTHANVAPTSSCYLKSLWFVVVVAKVALMPFAELKQLECLKRATQNNTTPVSL